MLKSQSIRSAVEVIEAAFGSSIERVDYWPSDREALGVVRSGSITPLVYFSTVGARPGSYFVSLELAPEEGSEVPFQDGGSRTDLSLDELVVVIADHLGVPSAPG